MDSLCGPQRTYTIVGTPEYLAPEMIGVSGHNQDRPSISPGFGFRVIGVTGLILPSVWGAAGTDLPQKLDGLNVNNWTRGFTWAMAKYIYPLVNCHITMENHHFWWVNPLFQWPFSSLQTVSHYQRVNINIRLTCHRWNGSETAALHPATQPPGRGLVGLGHFHLRVVGRWQHRFGLDKMDLVRTMLRFGTCWNMFFNIVPPMLTQKPQKSQNKPHLVGIVGETWQVRHPLRVRTPMQTFGTLGR